MSLKGQSTRSAVTGGESIDSNKVGPNSKQSGKSTMSNMNPNPLFVHPPVSDPGSLSGGKVSKKS